MSLLPFFQWMEALEFSQAIARSSWLAAAFNLAHLLALVVFIGSILIVDLRLLGQGLTDQPIARLARDARPWMIWGVAGSAHHGHSVDDDVRHEAVLQPFLLVQDGSHGGRGHLHAHPSRFQGSARGRSGTRREPHLAQARRADFDLL